MGSRKKLLRVIQERQLVSYSNNIKWEQFLNALENLPLRFRVKWIFETEPSSWGLLLMPSRGYIEPSVIGPISLREIEWLEIDSVERQTRGLLVADVETNHSDKIEKALIENRLAFTKEANIYRVFGYR